MVLLKKPQPDDIAPEEIRERSIGSRMRSKDDLAKHALKKGELIILKDDPEAKDWYCAEVRAILADRIEVNYFTAQTPALEEHEKCTVRDRKERLSEALFLRTWCLNGGKGDPTTTPPSTKYARMNHLWWGKIPIEAVSYHILIRDVGLDATERLDQTSLNLGAKQT